MPDDMNKTVLKIMHAKSVMSIQGGSLKIDLSYIGKREIVLNLTRTYTIDDREDEEVTITFNSLEEIEKLFGFLNGIASSMKKQIG